MTGVMSLPMQLPPLPPSASSTMTVPTVTATTTMIAMQSFARWGCRQQHLHGVRWGHGGFPGQIPTWDSACGGWTGWAVQIAEPGNGAVLGLVAPRGRRVPRSRGSCGWGSWGLPTRAEKLELPYLPGVLEPTWGRGSMLGVLLKPAPGQGLCWESTTPPGPQLTEVSLPQAPSPGFDLWS